MASSVGVVFKCSKCLTEIKQNETIIKCGGICESVRHKHCVNLGRSESKVLLENTCLKWFCDLCNNTTSILTGLFRKLESKIDKLQKCVSNQAITIESLYSQINNLEFQNKKNKNITDNKSKIVNKIDKPQAPSNQTIQHLSNYADADIADKPSNSKSFEQKTSLRKNQEINYPAQAEVTKNDDDRPGEQFTQVSYRRRRNKQRQFVEGSGVEEINTLKAIEKNAWIYVTRLSRDTTEQQVITHLAKICKVECTKLQLKNSSQFASFKICAPFAKKDSILDGKIWPRGTLINRYYFPRTKTEERPVLSQGDQESMDHDDQDFLNRTVIEGHSG